MSRSNPVDTQPNPATAWLEWKGKDGHLQYWDKQKEENVIVKLPFTFILLDRLATVRGFNKKLQSGIYSNEVRDTRSDPFVVKLFKGGIVAEGVWQDIKDRVTSRSMGGVFALNCYIAAKEGDNKLGIAAIQMSGCALGPWFEFEKEHSKAVENPNDPGGRKIQEYYAKAITITQGQRNEDGDIKFTPPVFSLKDISKESNAQAIALDKELQQYLTGYFGRTHVERTQTPAHVPPDDGHGGEAGTTEPEPEAHDDNVPF